MVDPKKLSLGARLADRETAGRSHPQHLRPVLYQHRVRALLAAAETAPSAGASGTHYDNSVVPSFWKGSAYDDLAFIDSSAAGPGGKRSGQWMSFGLGMASGVVCGWALTVIVVAAATSVGLQPTNAAIQESSIRPEAGRLHDGPELDRAMLKTATEDLGGVAGTRIAHVPTTNSSAGDFAVVPASITGALGWDNSQDSLKSGAALAGEFGQSEDRKQKVEVARAGMTTDLATQAQSAPSGEVAPEAVRHAAITRATPAATAPSKSATRASTSRLQKPSAKRNTTKARRQSKRYTRKVLARRGRSSTAVQNRAQRSAVGALTPPATVFATPAVTLTTAGLVKAYPDWAKKLFNSERFAP